MTFGAMGVHKPICDQFVSCVVDSQKSPSILVLHVRPGSSFSWRYE